MNNWYVYIIYSSRIDRYYIGSTKDIEKRLERHNMGWGRFTKAGIPWELVYYEEHKSKTEAIRREKELKQKKSRKYLEEQIKKAGGRPE